MSHYFISWYFYLRILQNNNYIQICFPLIFVIHTTIVSMIAKNHLIFLILIEAKIWSFPFFLLCKSSVEQCTLNYDEQNKGLINSPSHHTWPTVCTLPSLGFGCANCLFTWNNFVLYLHHLSWPPYHPHICPLHLT